MATLFMTSQVFTDCVVIHTQQPRESRQPTQPSADHHCEQGVVRMPAAKSGCSSGATLCRKATLRSTRPSTRSQRAAGGAPAAARQRRPRRPWQSIAEMLLSKCINALTNWLQPWCRTAFKSAKMGKATACCVCLKERSWSAGCAWHYNRRSQASYHTS